MATVQEILTETPRPTWALRPGYQKPLPEGMTLSRPSAGRTLDPASGLYTSVPSGKRRVFGPQQGLLVESRARTNHVSWSSAISKSNWTAGSLGTESARESVVNGETAYEQTGDGSIKGAKIAQLAGTFTGGAEIMYTLLEKGTSDLIAYGLWNATAGSFAAVVEYEWSTDSTDVIFGSARDVQVRTLRANGPNDAKLAHCFFRIGSGNAENVSGDSRQVQLYPDRNANGNSAIFHHAQVEEAPNASSPIVTGSSAVTRSGDDVSISVGDWWGENGVTVVLDLTKRFYTTNFAYLWLFDVFGFQFNYDQVAINFSEINFNTLNFSITPFERHKMAVAFDPGNEVRFSLDGSTKKTGDTPDLSAVNDITMPDMVPSITHEMSIIPRALPESSLDTITS